MKISDIPQLVHTPSNAVFVALSHLESTLGRIRDDYGLNLDPEFQRGHFWNPVQRTKYVEFLLRGGETAPLRFNSPEYGGFTRAADSDLSSEVVIVDGKQRLNTLLMFCSNQVPVFDGHLLNDFDRPRALLSRVGISYSVSKLQTRCQLLTWYLEMNEGLTAHAPEELDRVRGLLNHSGA